MFSHSLVYNLVCRMLILISKDFNGYIFVHLDMRSIIWMKSREDFCKQNMALHCSHNSKNTCFKRGSSHVGPRGHIPYIDEQLLHQKILVPRKLWPSLCLNTKDVNADTQIDINLDSGFLSLQQGIPCDTTVYIACDVWCDVVVGALGCNH